MAQRITIRDIAKHAGVSVGTASNVLNRKSNVDQTLQERVHRAVTEMNYRVNVHARGMILRRSFNVGVVIPSLTDPFFPRFASHLEEAVEERGSHVIIASSRGDAARERAVCDSLVAKQIDGLILTPCCKENIDYFNNLAADGFSIVQLGRYFTEIDAPIVMTANYMIGRSAVDRLYNLGHRRMLHLAGAPDSNPDRERSRGFTEAAQEMGISDIARVVDATNPSWRDVVQELFLCDSVPTAVFAADDLIALSFIKIARQMGIEIPRDVSVISIGPFFPQEVMMVDISTFTIDPMGMSRAASELLFSRIDSPNSSDDTSTQEVVVPMFFVEGDTTQLA